MTDEPDAASTPPPALAASALACERGNRLLFRDLDLAVGTGEALQVRGPNGSGKTSLLRLLGGLGEPVWGEIRWRGRVVRPGDPWRLADLAWLGHADGIKRELTATENLAAHRAIRGGGGLDPRASLARLGLGAHADTPVRALSAGQRRRAALARLLTTKARLWILDEPFNALDAGGIEQIGALLAEHLGGGGTVVLTSHLPVNIPGHRVAEVALR